MPYNEALAARLRSALDDRAGDIVEKKMFGGLAFMVEGRMACGIIGDDLMARVGPEGYDAAIARPHTRPMDFTGRPSRGMVYVGPAGIRTAAMLGKWLDEVVAVVRAEPKTKTKAKKTPTKKPIKKKKAPPR